MRFFVSHNLLIILALLCAIPPGVGLSAETITLRTVDGEEHAGTLEIWNSEKLEINTSNGPVTVASDQLLHVVWNEQQAPADEAATLMTLTDGSEIPVREFRVANRQATASSPLQPGQVSVSADQIDRVAFSPLIAEQNYWSELEEKDLTGDVLVIHKDSETLDYLTGLAEDVSEAQVAFRWEGDLIPVKLSKVAGIAYYHARQASLPDATCRISTTTGAKIPVREIELQDTDLRVRNLHGMWFAISRSQLSKADYSSGKLLYLSDLEPHRFHWQPFVSLPDSARLIGQYGAYRRDQSFLGTPLQLRWSSEAASVNSSEESYEKGLALRSLSEIEYIIPRGMDRFLATAGIDPSSASEGSVRLKIIADNRLIWDNTVEGLTLPQEINVPLDGARILRIVVDYGDNLDYGDRLHLVEARLSK